MEVYKMKYHKIYGVDLQVCTCEQKIAYNLASSYADLFLGDFWRVLAVNPGAAAAGVPDIARKIMSFWTMKKKIYDLDAIFCALNAGLYNYLCAGAPILWSYADIGKKFPANYLKVV